MKRVSVVVPTYRQAAFLPACLDSVWFQEYPDLEIVVVNDGSPDDTGQVLAEYLRHVENDEKSFASYYNVAENRIERVPHPRYPREGRRLVTLVHAQNRGLAAALNTGFAACTGDYCTYVPSDDRCYPHMLSELAAALDAGFDFAYGDMDVVDESHRVVRRFSLPPYSFERSFCDWYLCGVCKLYRRDLHERLGWYDESLLAHDHELFQRFAMAGARFVHVPRALMAILSHDGPREVDIHAPTNWNRLLEESKVLVARARAFAAKD